MRLSPNSELCLVLSAFALAIFSRFTSADEDEHRLFFESRIRPVLIEHCYSCHSRDAKDASGGLLLDSADGLKRGGTRGAAIRFDPVDASLFWRAISYDDEELQMPPDGKLPQHVLEDLRAWLEMGAPDPREESASSASTASSSIEALAASHWAYQPIRSRPAPEVSHEDCVRDATRSAIDVWIQSKCSELGIVVNPEADQSTLIRRLYHDLIGLPPTFEQIQQFTEDGSEDSYELLVDRLLSTPQFGERFARHWMDVTRYADTKGYVFQEDRNYPAAFRYRDWLIQSFNKDLPYDQFLMYQIAADHFDLQNEQGHLDAMGSLTLGRRFLNNPHDIADDRIDVITRGFMGLTLTCARCHDHKYDPISMTDYYSLHGVFVNSVEPGGDPSPLRLVDRNEIQPSHVFLRGNPRNQGERIERKFVAFFDKEGTMTLDTGSGRIDLARAIASADNPLTARVYVNRVWGWIFGKPLVPSTSDFGLRCDDPVHPELLDDLALDFVQNGWSTKRLVREMVLSAAYRRSSSIRPEGANIDSENRYWWRGERKRLDFETMRDSLLFVTDQLDGSEIGGPSQAIHESPGSRRRTVYAHIDRQNLPSLFRTFDFANPDVHVPLRPLTTVPQQGLFFLNGDFVFEAAAALGKRMKVEFGTLEKDDENANRIRQGVESMYRLVHCRNPSQAELDACSGFLEEAIQSPEPSARRWLYGTANWTGTSVENFRPFPVFHDRRWAGDREVPNHRLGWAFLNATGGHPGSSPHHAVVRRWIAPREGKVRIRGKLEHPSSDGDGVLGIILLDGSEIVGQWRVQHGDATTAAESIDLLEGSTLDFVVDSQANINGDSFSWTVQVRYLDKSSEESRSRRDFENQPSQTADAWTMLAQAILSTNEFYYVD